MSDRRTHVGALVVDLWRGLLRDEVRVWVDIRPAVGGLVDHSTVWRGRGDAEFDRVVERLKGA